MSVTLAGAEGAGVGKVGEAQTLLGVSYLEAEPAVQRCTRAGERGEAAAPAEDPAGTDPAAGLQAASDAVANPTSSPPLSQPLALRDRGAAGV